MLPNRIFFTGVPGSRWSGIAQILETVPGFNISDRRPDREYMHSQYSGHKGAYFGQGMDFPAVLDLGLIDSAWAEPNGTRIVKSHVWSLMLDRVLEFAQKNDDWLMLVYRPNYASYQWWHQAGGFKIRYPDYSNYRTSENMYRVIVEQNACMLKFAHSRGLRWHQFNSAWIEETFGHSAEVDSQRYGDVAVTVIK